MHFTQNLRLGKDEISACNARMRYKLNYAAEGIKSRQRVKTWTADFPRRYQIYLGMFSGDSEYGDPLTMQAILYKKDEEICRSETVTRLPAKLTCAIDENTSYSVNVSAGSPPDGIKMRIEKDRLIPQEKFDEYEPAFSQDIDKAWLAGKKPAQMKSVWDVNFPGNIIVSVQICIDKFGRQYVRAVLWRKKRKFAPVCSEPRSTLTEPFELKYKDKSYVVRLVPHEPKQASDGE